MHKGGNSLMNNLLEFYHYHVWSYGKLLEHLKSLPSEVLFLEFDDGFNSIASLLVHVFNTDNYWLTVLNKENHKTNLLEIESANDFEQNFKNLHISIKELLTKEMDFEKIIEFTSGSGNPMSNSISEIILTIANHGTYHRGNVSVMLRQLKFQSVSTDYAFYLRRLRST